MVLKILARGQGPVLKLCNCMMQEQIKKPSQIGSRKGLNEEMIRTLPGLRLDLRSDKGTSEWPYITRAIDRCWRT